MSTDPKILNKIPENKVWQYIIEGLYTMTKWIYFWKARENQSCATPHYLNWKWGGTT